ncbi:hypothetical protein GPJ56_002849 [Histomonas meleagridis]|uniref:uncharacterized protein n=1 Tax=Histomonas meleagridis TaxID=135588 RepID=UPI003559BA46|nr:hypothetical protein GPJ56_002849 [Histomonas meleagridis]KAH0806366.1 hypothetical protein GO595_001054 [Histomonas meleagridis]
MLCIPALQSWGIIPSDDRTSKFTKAHEYLERHPLVRDQIINNSRVLIHRKVSFSVNISNVDVNGNEISLDNILDLLIFWDLTDAYDSSILPDKTYEFLFRTAISAYTVTKIPHLIANPIDPIPNTARVPLVYIQGIKAETPFEEIHSFFRTIAPILKIKLIKKSNITAHILKFSSVRKALKVSETADREKFNGSTLYVSHQYKSSVTKCFFIQMVSSTPVSLTLDVIEEQVLQFGEIESSFSRVIGPISEFYIKMKNLKDAKLACGIMNHRTYDGVMLTSIFVEEQYFNEMFSS